MRVELVNAESLLLKTQNDLKASFADLNRSIGFAGSGDYVLEDVSTEVRTTRALGDLITDSLSSSRIEAGQGADGFHRRTHAGDQAAVSSAVSALVSGGTYSPFDPRQNQPTGGWWTAGALVSMPLFTGFLIENQVSEARAQKEAADAASLNVEQALTQQVTTAYRKP